MPVTYRIYTSGCLVRNIKYTPESLSNKTDLSVIRRKFCSGKIMDFLVTVFVIKPCWTAPTLRKYFCRVPFNDQSNKYLNEMVSKWLHPLINQILVGLLSQCVPWTRRQLLTLRKMKYLSLSSIRIDTHKYTTNDILNFASYVICCDGVGCKSIYLSVYSLHHNVLPTLQSIPLMTNGPLYAITHDSSCHGQHTMPRNPWSFPWPVPHSCVCMNVCMLQWRKVCVVDL